MTFPTERDTTLPRSAALAKARLSRRPSRLGRAAGAADDPDHLLPADAGFPTLLRQAWQRAATAPDLASAVDTLLTLAGHVPADIQLRALRVEAETALQVLVGRSWRGEGRGADRDEDAPTAFLGEIGLDTSGRIAVRVPSEPPLDGTADLVDGVLRVPWSAADLAEYQMELALAADRWQESVDDCRHWLLRVGRAGRRKLLADLTEAAIRTAPFILYAGGRQYTNFRERNTLAGKTLQPGHPDCTLSSLAALPLELWSDSDVLLVVCLTLLVRSGGYARIEEANGTQLTPDHVALLLERMRTAYNAAGALPLLAPAASHSVTALNELAEALAGRRRRLIGGVQLYREIYGPLMHKIERVAGPVKKDAERLEAELCAHLREQLPVTGDTFAALSTDLVASPGWLAEPHGEFGSGLESLVYEAVRAATEVFDADFAMSRGMRSLPALVRALREEAYPTIAGWEIPHFFCCVVPSQESRRLFGGSAARVADTAWAISSRMQYNSWHFLVGNLPKVPEVAARDHFVPPVLPDIAYYSDQHHNGHVMARVRFTVRSPNAVEVLGRRFNGFIDLRLLRCEGLPYDEQDLLAAHRASTFVASATSLAATLVADGANIEVSSFDSQWHWDTIAG